MRDDEGSTARERGKTKVNEKVSVGWGYHCGS